MNLESILKIVIIVTSLLLIISVLLQQQGSGLGSSFGGESSVYRTRRGAEKFLFRATIALAIIFVASSIAIVL
jgi:protein translocase SecG subunit